MNQKKRITSYISYCLKLFVVLFLIFPVMLSTTHAANSGSCGEDLKWELHGDTLTITGSGDMTDYKDNKFAPWYENASKIRVVELPDGLTSIGDLAFYGCENITTVRIPKEVTSIGDYAFMQCKQLLVVNLPNGLERIGASAFQECESLESIVFPNALTTIGSKAFYRCYELRAVQVPSSVTEMGNSIFSYCTGMVQAVINAPITVLPKWTFYGCAVLSDITLAETITVTDELAFEGCDRLNAVYTSSDDIEIAGQLQESILSQNPQLDENAYVAIYDAPITSNSFKDDGNVQTNLQVTQSENSVITREDVSSNEVAKEEASNEGGSSGIGSQGTVTTTTIDAVVNNSTGWKELYQATTKALSSDIVESVTVDVQVTGDTVLADDIREFAGKKVLLNISTPSGAVWTLDMSRMEEKSFKKEYAFDISVIQVDEKEFEIASDLIYQVIFSGDTKFNAMVGIPLSAGDAYQTATLYRKKAFGKFESIQTVVVDENGIAWFALADIKDNKEYYVAINVEGVTAEEALIPETLYDNYGVEEESYLTDSNGVQYTITGRTSSWGMDLKTVMIILAIVVFFLAVFIGVTLGVLNKRKAIKERYALEKEEEPIEEEAIYEEVLKEMLEKENKKK